MYDTGYGIQDVGYRICWDGWSVFYVFCNFCVFCVLISGRGMGMGMISG